jgi:DNA-binding response OmpR family regulator
MRILVVEDNAELSSFLVKALCAAGYDADTVTTVSEARAALTTRSYFALLLDLGLPDGDGLAMIKDLRSRNTTLPILIITARGGVHDRVKGLQAGASDYLVKPYAMEELIARLQALLRRTPGGPGQCLKLANLELVLEKDSSHLRIDGKTHVLAMRDLSILEILLQQQGRVVSKTSMVNHVAKSASSVSPNAIEVYVSRVRKTLEDRGARVSIDTVKGVGYLMHESV